MSNNYPHLFFFTRKNNKKSNILVFLKQTSRIVGKFYEEVAGFDMSYDKFMDS